MNELPRGHRLLRFTVAFAVIALLGCRKGEEVDEAGVGGARDSCGEPGSHSELISLHSCVCEDGYSWCSEALDEFECCADVDTGGSETGGGPPPPDQPCDESLAESLVCVSEGDPQGSIVWACNGERWIEVPGYADFACKEEGRNFAFGCAPRPVFLCGYGPGSPCEVEGFAGVCVDELIIDTCVWGRRTIDHCARLCGELEAFGPGFVDGSCQELDGAPAVCVCT